MSTPTTKRASLTEILEAAKAWLASYLSFPADRIKVIVPDGRGRVVPKMVGGQDILLEIGSFTADQDNPYRHDCRIHRELIVTIRTRVGRDLADRDDVWMTDATDGSIVWEEDVIDALQLQWLENGNRDVLTFEPMRIKRGGPRSHTDKDTSWGEVEIVFDLGISLPLTQRG